jgi:peroxiredoxin
MPAMERLYREFQDQGFVVLAVSLKDNQKEALSFVKEFNLTYPVGFDPEGKAGMLYGAWGLPTTYLIGPDGVALARLWGPADWHGPGARRLVQMLLEPKR